MKKLIGALALCIGLMLILSVAAGCGESGGDTDEGVYTSLEELCVRILLPALKDPAMRVEIEYDHPSEAAFMTVNYPGTFRPEDTDEALALALLGARSESVAHELSADGSRSVVRVAVR